MNIDTQETNRLTANSFRGGCPNCGYGDSKSLIYNQRCPFCRNNLLSNATGREEAQKGFEAHIRENPTDSSRHRIYADWLEENGLEKESGNHRRIAEILERPKFRVSPTSALRATRAARRASQQMPSIRVGKGRGQWSLTMSQKLAGAARRQILYGSIGYPATQGLPQEDRDEILRQHYINLERNGEPRAEPNHGIISRIHNIIADAHEQHGHHEAAEAHREAAAIHHVIHLSQPRE